MEQSKHKILRVATVALSLNVLLKGQLKYLNQYYQVIGVSGDDEHLDNVRKREGIKTINVRFSRPINLIQDLKSLWHIYKVIKKEQPTIVHSITPKAGLLSMIAAKMAGVPIRMHTFTGLVFPYKKGIFQKILITMDKVLCAAATHIYPEGKGVKKDLEHFGITKKNLKIIANGNVNGVDVSWFDPNTSYTPSRADLGFSDTDFVYIFVGRLVKDKGIEELINAFERLNSKYPDTQLLLVGPLEQDLDPISGLTLQLIHKHPNIKAVGYQDDVRPYFKMASCLVFPSHREGFPNVVLQAGAMGLPAIVTNISGSNEIIKHLHNGLIGAVNNPNELERHMEKLYIDTHLRQKLAANARPEIEAKYKQEMVWQCLKDEYENLLKHV